MNDKVVKKPPHEVVVEMIRGVIASFDETKNPNDPVEIMMQMACFATLIDVLKRMHIPEKHRREVIDDLHQIKKDCLQMYAERFFPESLFLAIVSSEEDNK